MPSLLQRLRTLAKNRQPSESDRILALPSVTLERAPFEGLALPGCALPLRPIQIEAIDALRHGGILGLIGVGHGKSWIALLCGVPVGAELVIIFAPASTLPTLEATRALLAPHYRLPPRVEIVSYTRLSRPEGTTMLDELCAGISDDKIVIVCDEAHKLKSRESARTKRLERFIEAHPGVRLAALSGTMANRSLTDYAHIADWTLGEGSPVPRPGACRRTLAAWSECLDAEGRPGPGDWRYIAPLMRRWVPELLPTRNYSDTKDAGRKAFQRRLRATPGVVASKEGSIGASLLIHSLALDLPDIIEDHLALCREGIAPTGEPIVDDVEGWRVARTLSQGFYYEWVWPGGVVDRPWLDARCDWHRHVRAELDRQNLEGYDSPLLVWLEIQRQVEAGAREPLHIAWLEWEDQRHKKPPPVRAVWVDDFFLRDVTQRAAALDGPCILWYEAKAVGEALEALGYAVYGAGATPPSEAVTCAMSIRAHGIGKNLQHWSRNIVLSPPSGGQCWEQLLGRTHRQGSVFEEIEVWVYQHTEIFRRALVSANRDARFLRDTQGNDQKLLFATWVLPRGGPNVA